MKPLNPCALKTKPTTQDADSFTKASGYITTQAWTHALYGFAGQIPINQINTFAQSDKNILLIDEEQTCKATIAYAAQQIGARTYVWNTLGLQGDPNSSIAIIDTGIDDSHPDFTPGYGNQNFTRKIIGWNDQISPGTTTPYDDNGHGSHVSGLAAGTGFFSTDINGNPIVTWGANLGSLDGEYFITGMMINKTGPITILVKWKNAWRGEMTGLSLYNGSKSLNTAYWQPLGSVSTPSQDTWYSLTYNVATIPPHGYDMYHLTLSFTSKGVLDDFYVVFKMSWPQNAPSDGIPAWTGIAPQTKLVGVKALDYSGSGTSTGLINGIDWVISNRQTYHIVIASMSLGFTSEVSTVDITVTNLVNSGITTIVAAGNSGSGANNIYTPGSVDEVITVAASNQFDNIVSFSSQGGPSRYVGQTTKPDIAAPGGSFYGDPLMSADSNDWDADKAWTDVQPNDGTPMQGTSMSAPVVSGAASLIVQVMGGFSIWQWTRNQALQPKMILLMTATETYPLLREPASTNSPTLQRGGKDVQEGYGRLNLDAAVDAVLQTYHTGTIVNGTLGKPPSLADISVLGQKLAWARKVQLNSAAKYNFTVSVPTGADFDLYIYNSTGTKYGEPAIVTKSVNATIGGQEQIILNPPYSGTYYVVIKRATATTGAGTFTLEATGKIVGDVNGDGSVNAIDLSILKQAYGSRPASFNWNSACDFNNDQIINVADLEMLAKEYGVSV